MAETLGTAVLELDTNDSKLVAGLAAAERTTRSRMGRVDRLGRTMTRNLTLPILGAGAASIKLAMDFNSTMGQIQGLAGASRKQTEAWGKQILDLAPKLGKAPEELARGLYFVASSGVPAAKAMDVLAVSAQASAAGLGETEVVADAVTSAMNAYERQGLSAAEATDILTATVREGKGEASAIAPVLGQLLPLASELGVGFEEVGGSIAQMTRLGMPAAEAGTALQAVMSGLLKPSVGASEKLESVGLSAAGLRDQLAKKGVLSVLDTLNTKFKGNTDAIAEVFPNIRALRGALALAGKAGKNSSKVFDGVANSTGALAHAFAVASEDAEFKFKQGMAGVQAAAIQVGNSLMPTFLRLVNAVRNLAAGWSQLSPGMQNFILIAAGLLAAVGPLVRLFVAVATAIRGIALACTFLAANPAVLLLAAFVALAVALVLLYRNSATFRNAIQAMGRALLTAFNAVKTAVITVRNAIQTAFSAVLSWLRSNWRTIAVIIAGPFAPLVALATNAFGIRSALVSAFQACLAAARAAVMAIVGAMRGAVGVMTGAARAVGRAAWNGLKAGLAALRGFFSVAWGAISGGLGTLRSTLTSAASAIGAAIVQGVWSGIQSLAGWLQGKIASWAGGLKDAALGALGIGSPSKVFRDEVGVPIMQGVEAGVKKQAGKTKKVISKAVQEAVTEAKRNMTGLASSIAGTLSEAIDRSSNNRLSALDNSAEAQRVRALQQQLDTEANARQKADLDRAITEAETDKERAEAQDALRTWELEQEKAKLEQQLADRREAITAEAEARKQALNQGITDLTDALNRGLISQATYTQQLNALIAAQAPEYTNLGALLGESAARGYIDTWNALLSQSGLVQFGGIGGSGADNQVISPEGVANQEEAKRKREEAARKKKAEKARLERQLANMRDVANNPSSPGGTTVTPAERQAIENMLKRIRGLQRGGWVGGPPGVDRAGVFRLSRGEGVFRSTAMEGMQKWFEKGGTKPSLSFSFGTVIGTDARSLARELAAMIQPELDRRVSLSS